MRGKKKEEIISFKVDEALSEALAAVPNRSEFIRSAILQALDNACPLCMGTGTLSPDQRRHWESFSRDHSVKRCDDCQAFHIICAKGKRSKGHD